MGIVDAILAWEREKDNLLLRLLKECMDKDSFERTLFGHFDNMEAVDYFKERDVLLSKCSGNLTQKQQAWLEDWLVQWTKRVDEYSDTKVFLSWLAIETERKGFFERLTTRYGGRRAHESLEEIDNLLMLSDRADGLKILSDEQIGWLVSLRKTIAETQSQKKLLTDLVVRINETNCTTIDDVAKLLVAQIKGSQIDEESYIYFVAKNLCQHEDLSIWMRGQSWCKPFTDSYLYELRVNYFKHKTRIKNIATLENNLLTKPNSAEKEPSEQSPQQTEKANKLNPDFLKGYRTRLNNCVKNGWLIENGDYYRACKGGTNKLAFILGVLWGGDYIKNGRIIKGNGYFPATKLERYFNVKTISDKRNRLSEKKKTQIYEEIYRTINI